MLKLSSNSGSQAEMCGNALRTLPVYLRSKQILSKSTILIETIGNRICEATLTADDRVTIRMGQPELSPQLVGVESKEPLINQTCNIGGFEETLTAVSMGNPHAVIMVDDVESCEVTTRGPRLEHHTSLFPQRINVEFVQLLSRDSIKMRVWERGAGETLSCGSGACAAVVACVINSLVDSTRSITVTLPGGVLEVSWSGDVNEPVVMTGPVAFVFEGVFNYDYEQT